jgi:hypothetical protein
MLKLGSWRPGSWQVCLNYLHGLCNCKLTAHLLANYHSCPQISSSSAFGTEALLQIQLGQQTMYHGVSNMYEVKLLEVPSMCVTHQPRDCALHGMVRNHLHSADVFASCRVPPAAELVQTTCPMAAPAGV